MSEVTPGNRTATGRLRLDPSSSSAPAPHAWLRIDLAAAEHNLRSIRATVAPARVCAVLKKNAYSLGAVPLARRLVQAGVDMIAVYSLDEAAELLAGAVDCPILIFHPVRDLQRTDRVYRHAAAGRLHLSLHDRAQLASLADCSRRLGLRLPLHLYLDTGMSRAGMDPRTALDALAALGDPPLLPQQASAGSPAQSPGGGGPYLAGVYTHLSSAENDPERTALQADRLDAFLDTARAAGLPMDPAGPLIHIANSYGILRGQSYHRGMVRPGLAVHGWSEFDFAGEPRVAMSPPQGGSADDRAAASPVLRPILRGWTRLSHVARYPAGATVGYGATATLLRDSILGVVPLGYGDGYPLALSDKAVMRLFYQSDQPGGGPPGPDRLREAGLVAMGEARVVGRVNMDQVVIDLSDAATAVGRGGPEPLARAFEALADRADPAPLLDSSVAVEFISDDAGAPNALPALAALAGTHVYEMTCRLSPRLTRVYAQR